MVATCRLSESGVAAHPAGTDGPATDDGVHSMPADPLVEWYQTLLCLLEQYQGPPTQQRDMTACSDGYSDQRMKMLCN